MHNTLKTIGILAFLLISTNATMADSSPIKNLKLAYDVFIGDMLAGSLDIDASADLEGYIIESHARSHGVFEFLTAYRKNNKAVGYLKPQGLRPRYYKAWGSWAGKRRTVEISYELLDRLSYKAAPTAAEDGRDMVPAQLLFGTTDPMTAFFGAIHSTSGATVCGKMLKIFDGRRRYDIHLSEIARSETKGPIYNGSARVCRARYTMLAGASRRIWLPQYVRPKWTDLWIASVQPDLPQLPVRVIADLGITDLVAHLVAIGERKHPPGEAFATNLQSEVKWVDESNPRME